MLIIGSAALRHYGIELPRSKKSDIDLICLKGEYDQFVVENRSSIRKITDTRHGHALHFDDRSIMEFDIAKEESSSADLLTLATSADYLPYGDAEYATPNIIYALKMSHRFLRNSPHFLKTMDDIIALRKLGYEIPDALQGDWMKKRQKETYYYSHPSLAQSKTNFFKDDAIPYKYDHDTIHEAVRLYARPAFEYIKKDAAEVYCSKKKFEEVSEAIRIATVLEESYVLALERHQIPNGFRPEPKRSFEIALKKVCTSIASGWWRSYAYDHYYDVLGLYDERYIERFHDANKRGTIKDYVVPEKHIAA